MNFNQVHFPDTYQVTNKEISILGSIQADALELLIDFLLSSNQVVQKSIEHKPFFYLLAKIRFNLEAVQLLMPKLTEDFRFKTSINLIYRGIVSDIINTLYLFSWCDQTVDEQPRLSTELDILQVDFLNAVNKIVEAESELSPEELERNKNWQQELILANLNLYDSHKGSWKKPRQIRKETGFDNDIDRSLDNPTETAKIMHIGRSMLASRSQIESCFKYLSQYQHFSPRMHEFLLSDPAYDLEVYTQVVHLMLVTLKQVSQVLNYNDPEIFKVRYEAVEERFWKAYPPSQVPPKK